MNILMFLSIASFLALLYVILGLRASKNVRTDQDYYVAGRSLGIPQITCNLIATQLGGGMLLGTAAASYNQGYYGIFYTAGMCIGFLLLAAGVASRLQQFRVTTTAQLFETQYHSPFLKKLASLLSIATMFGILIAQVVGFKSLLAGVGVTSFIFVLLFWLSIIGFTMIGGLRAITINDIVQLAIIVTVFGLLFLYAIFSDSPSTFSLTSFVQNQRLFTVHQKFAPLFSIIAMPALFSLIQQDLAQRFFASRSKAVATISAFNAALFLFLFASIPVYFGMKARLVGLELGPQANPLIVIIEQMTNDFVFSLVLCAIVAAIVSTADALMNAVSANITQDFDLSFIGFRDTLAFSKVITFVVGISALIASYGVPPTIIDIIIASYELSVSCLLVPLLFCYFKPHVKKEAAFGAIVAGFIGFILFSIYPLESFPKEIVILTMSLVGYGLGSIRIKR